MIAFFNQTSKSVIHHLLDALDISYTNRNLASLHRNDGSLLGVESVLNEYNIENLSIKLNKNDLIKMEVPFVAHQSNPNDFVLVTSIDDEAIEFTRESGEMVNEILDNFLNRWSGVVLLAEPNSDSKEKNYALNKRLELSESFRLPFIAVLLLTIITYCFISNNLSVLSYNIHLVVVYLLYWSGAGISLLLLYHGFDKNNLLVNKICNLNKKSNCNSILDSSAAKLFGTVSWSEIGFVYFSGSLLTLSIVPAAITILIILSTGCLVYSVWSIYYQWRIAKEWCVLCLITQLIFWLVAFTFIISGKTHLIIPPSNTFLVTFFCFAIPFALLYFIVPLLNNSKFLVPLRQELNFFKSNKEVFEACLKTGEQTLIDGLNKELYLGTEESPYRLTIVNNPYCGPCANIHKKAIRLVDNPNNNIKLEMIYAVSSTDMHRNEAIKYLIAVHLQYSIEEVSKITSEWYDSGKITPDNFMKKYPIDNNDQKVLEIFSSHFAWCESSEIDATPTIFMNGYRLPMWYEIEDLEYVIKH